jgi:hypothetical protein
MSCGQVMRESERAMLRNDEPRSRFALCVVQRILVIAVAAILFALLGAPARGDAAEQACANEGIRVEQQSTFLPDCRAYELVSPTSATPYLEIKTRSTASYALSSTNGNALAWFSFYPIAGSEGGFNNVSVRGTDGWTSESVMPRLSASQQPLFACRGGVFFSEDLTTGVMMDGEDSDALDQEGSKENANAKEAEYCGGNDPALVENEPKGFQNLFMMNLSPRKYVLLNPGASTPKDARFQAASPDMKHVVFEENAALVAGALPARDLYEWSESGLGLVSVLPKGAAVEGELADGATPDQEGGNGVRESAAQSVHAVSNDGSRVFFRADGNLYVRMHAMAPPHAELLDPEECVHSAEACTIQIDASAQPGGRGGGGRFLAASADGSKVYFLDESAAELTKDTATGSGYSLYEYEVETGRLVDLTPGSLSETPDVLGLSAIGETGGSVYLYFAAGGKLASTATTGRPNLYVSVGGGAPGLVATLTATPGGAEEFDWQKPEGSAYGAAEASPDGRYFVFQSANSGALTGYNDTDRHTGRADEEIFLYDASSGALACVSCDPTHARPVGSAELGGLEGATDSLLVQFGPNRQLRNVLDDGSVFFNSPDPLVEGVEGGTSEVYEYQGGELHLVSGGTSPEGSYFYEASPTGENVFFVTAQSLLKSDSGNTLSIYDARAGGGFAEPPEPAPCEGEACHGPGESPSAYALPGSNTFTGPGDLPPGAKKHGLSAAQREKMALRACARVHPNRRQRGKCERRVRSQYGRKKRRLESSVGRRRA